MASTIIAFTARQRNGEIRTSLRRYYLPSSLHGFLGIGVGAFLCIPISRVETWQRSVKYTVDNNGEVLIPAFNHVAREVNGALSLVCIFVWYVSLYICLVY